MVAPIFFWKALGRFAEMERKNLLFLEKKPKRLFTRVVATPRNNREKFFGSSFQERTLLVFSS
jgi:hypothetical protein